MAENISNIKSTALQGLEGFSDSAVIFTQDVDNAFWIHMYISIFLFAVVVGAMLYFAWKYRASNVKDEDIVEFKHHTGLEIAWTVIPTALLMVMFYYGYTSMKSLRTMPDAADSMIVQIKGEKWKWTYTYENGKTTPHLFVPKDKNVILEMSAPDNDVIHAWYVPAFRMKEDVVPGRITKQWFNANKTGSYVVECAEYCGTSHSDMYSEVHVMEPEAFSDWYEESGSKFAWATPSRENFTGEELFGQNCTSCHNVDSTTKVGPGLSGVASRYTSEQVDDIVANGKNEMPPFSYLPENDLRNILDYIKGIK